MEYNSAREHLIIPEYGRNVQTLVAHAKTIENPAHRQAFVEEILNLVQAMNPQTRNVEDYRAKLWAHILRIADYDLDVRVPPNVSTKPVETERPAPIPYPKGDFRYRHYGRNVEQLIQKARDMKDPEKQEAFAIIIAAYMKSSYKVWNRPTVSDDTIRKDLNELSKNELAVDENIVLDNAFSYIRKKIARRNNKNNASHRQHPPQLHNRDRQNPNKENTPKNTANEPRDNQQHHSKPRNPNNQNNNNQNNPNNPNHNKSNNNNHHHFKRKRNG